MLRQTLADRREVGRNFRIFDDAVAVLNVFGYRVAKIDFLLFRENVWFSRGGQRARRRARLFLRERRRDVQQEEQQ